MESVCTVIFSGASSISLSMVFSKLSTVSVGRPAIISVFIESKPTFLARSKLSKNCAVVCFLPIASRTLSFKVCGFIDTLPQPFALSTFSFSSVMVSGLPASTVYSRTVDISKLFSMTFIPLSS